MSGAHSTVSEVFSVADGCDGASLVSRAVDEPSCYAGPVAAILARDMALLLDCLPESALTQPGLHTMVSEMRQKLDGARMARPETVWRCNRCGSVHLYERSECGCAPGADEFTVGHLFDLGGRSEAATDFRAYEATEHVLSILAEETSCLDGISEGAMQALADSINAAMKAHVA